VSASDTQNRHVIGSESGIRAGLRSRVSWLVRPQILEEWCNLLTLCNLLCYIALINLREQWHDRHLSHCEVAHEWSLLLSVWKVWCIFDMMTQRETQLMCRHEAGRRSQTRLTI
jgi:hypothetical protein